MCICDTCCEQDPSSLLLTELSSFSLLRFFFFFSQSFLCQSAGTGWCTFAECEDILRQNELYRFVLIDRSVRCLISCTWIQACMIPATCSTLFVFLKMNIFTWKCVNQGGNNNLLAIHRIYILSRTGWERFVSHVRVESPSGPFELIKLLAPSSQHLHVNAVRVALWRSRIDFLRADTWPAPGSQPQWRAGCQLVWFCSWSWRPLRQENSRANAAHSFCSPRRPTNQKIFTDSFWT